ncbi:response regulator receiver:ANTAR [Cupriavidus basilensis OR16]|uniref:Response regulator receiver:ANTAR n=1 Tax=Cupriavidus basilensis OR16 TaxID=1127483 RepID=H1SCX6_9BURK|nr:response regulator receiver:ANTAR [Cupriavidus basilensis OR16]
MKERGMTEDEAYKRLQTMAMERGIKVVEPAWSVIDLIN